MRDDTDFSATDTIPIPLLDVERKTLPVKCPWCSFIVGVAKTDAMRLDKTAPYYRACGKCQYFINDGMVFIRSGNSNLRRRLVSFCRQMRAFMGK